MIRADSGNPGAARAPYNFVPFHTKGDEKQGTRSERVFIRYGSPEEIPGHDKFDPSLLTGEIQVTLQAETPVFVSNGEKRDATGFLQGPDGQYMIPGSTIRGMVRENMQILGFGAVREGEDLKDRQIYFREIAAASDSTGDPLKKYYKEALDIAVRRDRGRTPFSLPRRVSAGYLHRRGDSYYIQPVQGGTYIRVPRKNKALINAGLTAGEARTVPVCYRDRNGAVTALRRGSDPAPGMKRGVLLYTGRSVPGRNKTENARYLFPEEDPNAEPLMIPDADRIAYQEDFENRVNSLKPRENFWRLPEGDESKPVFYLKHDGHIYFGMSLFLRIGYIYPLKHGLPPQTEADCPLDYPHAMLGYTSDSMSFRSRVSFGDFPVLGPPQMAKPIRAILGEPRPSWYTGYVKDAKNYNLEDFQLRGFKLYWLRKTPDVPLAEKANEKVKTLLRPLDTGTRFQGVIRFKNLHEDELGLLLWSLRLDWNRECWQSLGMGKPFGLGRMKLTVNSLRLYDPAALYAPDGLCGSAQALQEADAGKYIQAYDRYICEHLPYRGSRKGRKSGKAVSIRTVPGIQDFFYFHSVFQTGREFGYMNLDKGEFKNIRGALPEV